MSGTKAAGVLGAMVVILALGAAAGCDHPNDTTTNQQSDCDAGDVIEGDTDCTFSTPRATKKTPATSKNKPRSTRRR